LKRLYTRNILLEEKTFQNSLIDARISMIKGRQEVIMVNEEEVKKLAWFLWEAERRPVGRDYDHFFRAKRMLEERERINSNIRKFEHMAMSPS
jgi:hypothetical protein